MCYNINKNVIGGRFVWLGLLIFSLFFWLGANGAGVPSLKEIVARKIYNEQLRGRPKKQ